uniref:Uncharacterized protein n=1 Tax=Leersia perrieri TaxID=77586 RepID=A0A0D9VPE8_9ORYZ
MDARLHRQWTQRRCRTRLRARVREAVTAAGANEHNNGCNGDSDDAVIETSKL